MPDAGKQMWKNGVPKMSSSHHWKNKSEQEQNKDDIKKELREMEKREKKKRRMKEQWKTVLHKMILGLITLKHSLDLLILSFGTPNPDLHYVP